MGSIVSGLFGGSKQSSSGQSGFSMLPPEIQSAFTDFANALKGQIGNATSAYTPLPETADETKAFGQIRQGYTPTADSLNSDVSMLMNPFNSSVIDQINRQANGSNSILKQNLNSTGQFGSNRQILGANDIENSRQSNIGSLLQGQYNTAIGQIFNNLIPQRQADTQGLLGIGNFQRNLSGQTKQAPITGLQQIAQALGILPNSGGATQTSSGSSSGSVLGGLGGASGVGSLIRGFGGLFG